MSSVQVNEERTPQASRIRFDWRKDLEASRDLMRRDIDAYGYVLSWIEDWRIQRDLPPGRDAMEAWWMECGKKKEQPAWRLRQWAEAISWYLGWLELCHKSGGTGKSIPERLKDAVHGAGARRGLALRTRQTYAGWVLRFGAYAGTESRVMDEAVARDWLSHLVDKEKVAFATQKQALNALVFFYRDVCGREEVDMQVKLRQTPKRAHVVLSKAELMGLVGKLEEIYKTPALLQYGGGLRLQELVQLRIKDVDVERGRVKGYASRDWGGCSHVTEGFYVGRRTGRTMCRGWRCREPWRGSFPSRR